MINKIANTKYSKMNILLKVIILGDEGVGKTSLMTRFVSHQFTEQSFRTIGIEFMSKNLEIDQHIFKLQVSKNYILIMILCLISYKPLCHMTIFDNI